MSANIVLCKMFSWSKCYFKYQLCFVSVKIVFTEQLSQMIYKFMHSMFMPLSISLYKNIRIFIVHVICSVQMLPIVVTEWELLQYSMYRRLCPTAIKCYCKLNTPQTLYSLNLTISCKGGGNSITVIEATVLLLQRQQYSCNRGNSTTIIEATVLLL